MSAPLGTTQYNNRSVHRPVKTCTECKQVKLRCDSRAKFPAPCTRCQTKNLQCAVDSTFRRTPARKRVEEMAKELKALRHRREENGLKSTASPSTGAETTFDSPEYTLEQSGTAIVSDLGLKDYYELGDFRIDQVALVEAFKLFAVLFYPHFPIINPQILIAVMHDTTPLLFWTIIAIVLSHNVTPPRPAQFELLREPYLARLQKEILQAPLPLQTIQALTYLIVWPFPAERQSHDSSWLYCGVAINAAQYMGLHHSKPTQSLRSIGVPSGSPRARAHTWLGCFLASTSVGMHVGVSPSMNGTTELATIEHFIRTYPIPSEFAYQVMVQHTLAKFTTVVLENRQEVVSHSLVKLIDTELDGLKTKYPTPWTPRVELAVLVAKIQLYTMTIIRIQLDLTSREILMKSGFSAALRIVYLSDQGLNYQATGFPGIAPETIQLSIPKNHFRALVLATVFLLRFFALNINATPEEQETARNHIAMSQRYFKAGSMKRGDELERGALLLEMLSRQPPVDLDHTKLRIDDRMGASLVYDAITTGHELRNINTEVEEETPSAENAVPARHPTDGAPGTPPINVTPDINMDGLDGMETFGQPLDFSLPDDLWGDSVWGMFGTFAPTQSYQ